MSDASSVKASSLIAKDENQCFMTNSASTDTSLRYRRDFDFVASALKEGYVFLRKKEEEWGFRFEEVERRCAQRLPDIVSDFEFWLLLKEVVAPLHDGHTHVGWDAPFASGARRFGLPFELRHLEGKYYVDTWRDGVPSVRGIGSGDEVVSIGGYVIENLQRVYDRYEGHSTAAAQRAILVNVIPLIFHLFLPACDFDAPVEIGLVTRDGGHRVRRVPWVALPRCIDDQTPANAFTHRWLRKDPSIACLRVGHFFFPGPNSARIVEERLDAVFAEIDSVEGLVLDIRHSGGGSFGPMAGLIGRIIQEPIPNFERRWFVSENFLKYHEWGHHFSGMKGFTDWEFDGDPDRAMIYPSTGCRLSKRIPVVVVTGLGTVSRGEQLAQMLQEAGIVRTLGETTAGADACPLQVVLPEMGWRFSYSVAECRSPKGYNIEGRGGRPDVPVRIAPEELGSNRDRYLEEAERLLLEII